MNKIDLFIDSANNYFLHSKTSISCEDCKTDLNNIFFMIINWGKKKSSCKVICNKCLMKVDKTGEVFEAKYGSVTDTIEPDFTPVFIETPTFTTSKKGESVFSASDLESDETIDKAHRSKRWPSLEGSSVGKSFKHIEEESSERLIEVESNLLEHKRK